MSQPPQYLASLPPSARLLTTSAPAQYLDFRKDIIQTSPLSGIAERRHDAPMFDFQKGSQRLVLLALLLNEVACSHHQGKFFVFDQVRGNGIQTPCHLAFSFQSWTAKQEQSFWASRPEERICQFMIENASLDDLMLPVQVYFQPTRSRARFHVPEEVAYVLLITKDDKPTPHLYMQQEWNRYKSKSHIYSKEALSRTAVHGFAGIYQAIRSFWQKDESLILSTRMLLSKVKFATSLAVKPIATYNSKQPLQYNCNECGQKFRFPAALAKHTETHQGGRLCDLELVELAAFQSGKVRRETAPYAFTWDGKYLQSSYFYLTRLRSRCQLPRETIQTILPPYAWKEWLIWENEAMDEVISAWNEVL